MTNSFIVRADCLQVIYQTFWSILDALWHNKVAPHPLGLSPKESSAALLGLFDIVNGPVFLQLKHHLVENVPIMIKDLQVTQLQFQIKYGGNNFQFLHHYTDLYQEALSNFNNSFEDAVDLYEQLAGKIRSAREAHTSLSNEQLWKITWQLATAKAEIAEKRDLAIDAKNRVHNVLFVFFRH